MPGYKQNRGENTWRLTVSIGSDFSGKRKRFTKTVHCNEKEADKQLALFYADCERGLVNKSDLTSVTGAAEAYLNNHTKRRCKQSVYQSTESAINIWIKPYLGKRKINKIKRFDIQEEVNFLDDEGKSPKTIRNYYSVLRGIFEYAIDMGIIDSSPCHNIRLPKKKQKEANFYTIEEVERLLRAAESTSENDLRFKCAVYLGLFGGLRRAEICGLDWDDINLDTGEIHVNRNRLIGKTIGIYEDTPKTEKSNRYVTVPSFMLSDLKNLKLQQEERKRIIGDEYTDTSAVLQGERGAPIYPQVLQRWFTVFCKRNQIPAYGLHALRHTHASMLANLKTDKMQVSTRLGHSQLSTTLNIYTHLFEEADREVATSLNDFMVSTLTPNRHQK